MNSPLSNLLLKINICIFFITIFWLIRLLWLLLDLWWFLIVISITLSLIRCTALFIGLLLHFLFLYLTRTFFFVCLNICIIDQRYLMHFLYWRHFYGIKNRFLYFFGPCLSKNIYFLYLFLLLLFLYLSNWIISLLFELLIVRNNFKICRFKYGLQASIRFYLLRFWMSLYSYRLHKDIIVILSCRFF